MTEALGLLTEAVTAAASSGGKKSTKASKKAEAEAEDKAKAEAAEKAAKAKADAEAVENAKAEAAMSAASGISAEDDFFGDVVEESSDPENGFSLDADIQKMELAQLRTEVAKASNKAVAAHGPEAQKSIVARMKDEHGVPTMATASVEGWRIALQLFRNTYGK